MDGLCDVFQVSQVIVQQFIKVVYCDYVVEGGQ